MLHRNLVGHRLVALFMLGWLLFNYPLLALFDGESALFGLPAIYLYLFAAWALLILLMGWIAEDRRSRPAPREQARPAPPEDGK